MTGTKLTLYEAHKALEKAELVYETAYDAHNERNTIVSVDGRLYKMSAEVAVVMENLKDRICTLANKLHPKGDKNEP